MTEDNVIKIVVALIALLSSLLGAVIAYLSQNKKQAVENAKREQEQMDNFKEIFKRFDQVDKRLAEHNHYAEKFGEVAKSIVALQKDIEHLKSK